MQPLIIPVYEFDHLTEIPPQVQQFDFGGSKSGSRKVAGLFLCTPLSGGIVYLCIMKSKIFNVLGGISVKTAAAVCMIAAAACNNQGKSFKTETFTASDTTSRTSFTMKAELPTGKDAASANIRKELVGVMDSQLAFICSFEGDRVFPAFEGEGSNEAVFNYYKENAAKQLRDLAGEDAAERAEYFDGEIPGWEYDFSLTKTADTLGYVVFQDLDYIYTGGAHGGMTGQGSMTFDRESGERIKILKDDVADAMQPLLVKGLISYFGEYDVQMTEDNLMEHLMLWESTQIPLPGWDPCPSADGLVFTYQQYEIASYADGMPSFTVPYEEIRPFLSEEALKALHIQ